MLSSNMQITHGDLDIVTCRKIIRHTGIQSTLNYLGLLGTEVMKIENYG
jgi:hypothetical protein